MSEVDNINDKNCIYFKGKCKFKTITVFVYYQNFLYKISFYSSGTIQSKLSNDCGLATILSLDHVITHIGLSTKTDCMKEFLGGQTRNFKHLDLKMNTITKICETICALSFLI